MVACLNKGTPLKIPTDYNPYYRDRHPPRAYPVFNHRLGDRLGEGKRLVFREDQKHQQKSCEQGSWWSRLCFRPSLLTTCLVPYWNIGEIKCYIPPRLLYNDD